MTATRWTRIKHFWHGCYPDATTHFDGASMSARCSVCNRRCLQDSYGQWFPISETGR